MQKSHNGHTYGCKIDFKVWYYIQGVSPETSGAVTGHLKIMVIISTHGMVTSMKVLDK